MELNNDLVQRVRETIYREDLIVQGDHVILALSGGPDSVCLFHALLTLSKEIAFTLSAVHVNHKLRGNASDEDSKYVRELCCENNVPVEIVEIDINELATSQGLTVEEAGREARYNTFDKVANRIVDENDLSEDEVKIATAHNSNDQIETLLMRIVRGTGPAGLAGIPVKRIDSAGFEIIRPLLETDRATIEDYLRAENIMPRIDKTNEDTKYFRNKIRHKLMPIIEEEFGASAFDSILRLSKIAEEEKDYFDAVVAETIDNNCEYKEPTNDESLGKDVDDYFCNAGESFEIPLELLQGVHPVIRHKLIMGIFAELGLNQDLGAVHLAAADDLILKGNTGKRINVPKGYYIEITYDKVEFRASKTIEEIKKYEIESSEDEDTFFETEFDSDALDEAGLTPMWRCRLPGDRIRPEGMDGSKKLQDLFVDMKIPRDVRDKVKILAAGDNILWIPGIRKSRDFAVTERTKNVAKYKSSQKLFEK